MKMNEPPNVPPTKPPRPRHFARLTLQAQVIAVLMYVAVVMVLLAAIAGAGAFMLKMIREAI